MAKLISSSTLKEFKVEYKKSLVGGKFDFVLSKSKKRYCVLEDDSLLSLSDDFDAKKDIVIGSYLDDKKQTYHYMYNPVPKEVVFSI